MPSLFKEENEEIITNPIIHNMMNVDEAVGKITGLLKKTAKTFYEIGVILKTKDDIVKGLSDKVDKQYAKLQYEILIDKLPFGEKVAKKFIQIAENKVIGENLDIMPCSYNTLYSLRLTTEDELTKLKEKGLNSWTTAKELSNMFENISEESKDDDEDNSSEENQSLLNKNKKSNNLENLNMKVGDGDDDEDGLLESFFQYLNIKVEAEKLTSFEKSKLKDLMKLVDKLKFSGDKGVTLEHNINVDILSDEPVQKVA